MDACLVLLLFRTWRGSRRCRRGTARRRSDATVLPNPDPLRIPVAVAQEMLPRGDIVLLHHPRVPAFVDGPKDANLATNHAIVAVPVSNFSTALS
jgi:hypothetical protein